MTDLAHAQAMAQANASARQAEIPLGQIPTIVQCGVAMGVDGQRLAVLRVSTPMGPLTFLITAEQAEQAGDQLKLAAAQARTGLTIPGMPG
jgi:hypothetical protein